MSPPLRIAMFVGCFPVVSETFILGQITGLLDQGHEVDIYADMRADLGVPVHPEVMAYDLMRRTTFMDLPPEMAPWEMPVRPATGRTWIPGTEASVHNAIRVAHAFPKFLASLVRAPKLALRSLKQSEFAHQAASLSALYRLDRLRRARKRYDVLHAHFGPVANSFRLARALWNAPLVATFHGYDFCVNPRKEGNDVYRALFRNVDAVTVNCDYARERLVELGCPRGCIHKLHVGVNVGQFAWHSASRNRAGPICLITVGRLVQKKGIEFAIRAAAAASRKHPDIRYDIIGDGPLRADLQRLTVECGLQSRVTLHGAKDNQFVRKRMAGADIFILSSVTADNGDQEGTPVSLMEAQAGGLPVLSTEHSGIPEVVLNGESGFLVPERDVTALTEKLSFLIEHPEVRERMGARGREHVEAQFDLRRLNRDLVEIYRESVGRFSGTKE